MTTEAAVVEEPPAPAQSVLYRFLAEGFSPPDSDRLAYLRGMVPAVEAACAEIVEAGQASGLPKLQHLTEALDLAVAASVGDIQAEYTRLFVAGRPTTPCRLLESVQRERALVGESAEDAASTYFRFGLEAQTREPDHLATELEFLAYLTGTPVGSEKDRARANGARQRFLQQHLLAWGPRLVTKIHEHTSVPPFPALADLLGWLLASEAGAKV
jgi:TorA maturation chaperone TorD